MPVGASGPLRRRWLGELALALLPTAAFAVVAAFRITLPGLYYDEAADAVLALDLLQGRPPELVRGHGVTVFGRTWPLMAFDYVGAVHSYAALVFFAVLGPGVAALRLMTIAGGAVTVALTYTWVRWLFRSRAAGLAAALLLATHPSWVFYTRQGVHVSSLMALWLMGALVLLLAWRRTGHWGWLPAASFLLGLGLSTKLLFLWAIVALLGVYVAWRAPAGWRALHGPPAALAPVRARLPQLLLTVGAFVAGAAPLLLYNLQTGGTVATVARSAEVTEYGVRNSEYLANLWARLDTLSALLHGGHFWFLGGLYSNPLFPPATAAAAAGLAWGAARRRTVHAPAVALLLGVCVLVVLQSPLTVSGIWPTHLFILLPLLCSIPAVALVLWAGRARAAAAAATLGAAALLAGNLSADAAYHDALVRTGGHRGHSDAVYRLASYLDEQGVPAPLAMDWGIRYTVQLVTQGRVRPVEAFGYTAEPDPGFVARLQLDVPEQRYLFHGEDYTHYPRFEAFHQAAERAGKRVRLEATFYERSGTPVYLVYSVT